MEPEDSKENKEYSGCNCKKKTACPHTGGRAPRGPPGGRNRSRARRSIFDRYGIPDNADLFTEDELSNALRGYDPIYHPTRFEMWGTATLAYYRVNGTVFYPSGKKFKLLSVEQLEFGKLTRGMEKAFIDEIDTTSNMEIFMLLKQLMETQSCLKQQLNSVLICNEKLQQENNGLKEENNKLKRQNGN